jgi:Flp pilus assembly protein TadG
MNRKRQGGGHAAAIVSLLSSSDRQGAVAVLFATTVVALLMMVGLAVEYSFYNEAQTQLNVAADSAALHAVRVAAQAVQSQQTNYIAQGEAAGLAWFEAQAGNVPQAKFVNTPVVTVAFNSTSNLLTAQVSYTGVVINHFGALFPGNWQNWPNLGIAGASTAVQSTQTYIEIDMLLDNSSSMLIAANPTGIAQLDTLTPCSVQAAGAGQPMDGTYTWQYNPTNAYGGPNNASSNVAPNSSPTSYIQYGYGAYSYAGRSGTTYYANEAVPPASPVAGQCLSSFTGPTSGSGNECPYPAATLPLSTTSNSYGYAQCVNSSNQPTGGGNGTWLTTSPVASSQASKYAITATNVPQAPCAFACHWTSSLASGSSYTNDYYGLARQNGIQLRFDVVQSAAENVITTLQQALPTLPVPAPFNVNVFTFANSLGTIYSPSSTATSASQETAELSAALTAIENYQTPVVSDSADTDFPDTMATLATKLSNAGTGTSSAAPRKNLFIVTDGLTDYTNSGGTRVMGPFDTASCTAIKNMGIEIYVLYTDYYPLPNYFYLENIQQYAEPTDNSAISSALQQCASSPSTYFEASDSTSIQSAMQTMLKIALSSPGRYTQ